MLDLNGGNLSYYNEQDIEIVQGNFDAYFYDNETYEQEQVTRSNCNL